MSDGVEFEPYLKSKKIDSEAFRKAEPTLWHSWKNEFDRMHPNSFTLQKLNLINPIRRKYLLIEPAAKGIDQPAPVSPPPRAGKPIMRKRPDEN